MLAITNDDLYFRDMELELYDASTEPRFKCLYIGKIPICDNIRNTLFQALQRVWAYSQVSSTWALAQSVKKMQRIGRWWWVNKAPCIRVLREHKSAARYSRKGSRNSRGSTNQRFSVIVRRRRPYKRVFQRRRSSRSADSSEGHNRRTRPPPIRPSLARRSQTNPLQMPSLLESSQTRWEIGARANMRRSRERNSEGTA